MIIPLTQAEDKIIEDLNIIKHLTADITTVYSMWLKTGNVGMVYAPTLNCQLYTLAGFDIMQSRLTEEQLIAWFKYCNIEKPLALIDVRRELATSVVNRFKEFIVVRADYTNTYQEHQMTLFIINMKQYLYDYVARQEKIEADKKVMAIALQI